MILCGSFSLTPVLTMSDEAPLLRPVTVWVTVMRIVVFATFALLVGHSVAVAQVIPGEQCPAPRNATGGFRELQFPGASETWPFAINSQREVVGYYSQDGSVHGFLYRSGTYVTVDGPGPGNTLLTDINDAGVIVGMNGLRAFKLEGGIFTTIEPPDAGATFDVAINNLGEIAGSFRVGDSEGPELGFVWRNGVYETVQYPGHDPAQFGTVVFDINVHGDLLGNSSSFFVRQDGRFEVLHECMFVRRITDARHHVGRYAAANVGAVNRGDSLMLFKYPKDAQSTGLHDMNSEGAAVGVSLDRAGQTVGFLYTPPEPLRVETPNTSSRWGLNTHQRLAWTYAGEAPQFLVEISRDSGRTWTDLATVANAPGDSQNFDWTVTGPLTSAAKFRVSAVGEPDATDINDTDIRIANATIEVLSPTSATSVPLGASLTVFYRHSLGARAPVAIEVSGDNGGTWRTVATTATTGSTTSSFVWAVDLLPTIAARVRIRSLDGSGARATSRAFAVTAAGP